MSRKLYKVKGSFTILSSLEETMKPGGFGTQMFLEDVVRIALQDGHLKVKDVKIATVVEEKAKKDEEMIEIPPPKKEWDDTQISGD